MVALIPVACQTAPDPSTSPLLYHLSYCCTPSTWACPAATLITTFAATCIIICIHFQSVRQSFSLTRSPSLSLSLSFSLSVSQLLSCLVSQSFSQLFLVVCLHYLLAPFTHIWFASPLRPDLTRFSLNIIRSQRKKRVRESEGEGKNWRWWILALTQKTSALSLRRKTCLPDWLWSAF